MPPQVNIKVTADTKQAQQNLSGFSKSFTELNSKLQLVQQAAGIFSDTIEKAFDMGREGAQVIQTAESFDLLLDKIGAAPDLFDKLKKAGGGTISEMKMMSSTATLLAGASGDLATSLANATPQLLEIARAANKLNPSLGDTTFLYDSLATGVKRASPMILDNLGLTIKVGEANEKYARQLGKATTALTAEEQKQALLNATLEAGQVLIEQVGGNVDSATDSFTRMDASIENATNALKSKLAPAISNAADAIYYLLEGQKLISDALSKNETELVSSGASWEEYVEKVVKMVTATKGLSDAQAKAIKTSALEKGNFDALTVGLNYTVDGLQLYTQEEYNLEGARTSAIESARRAVEALAIEKAATEQNRMSASDYILTLTDSHSATDLYARKAQDAAQDSYNLGAGLRDAKSGAEEMNSALASVGTVTNFGQINEGLDGVIDRALEQIELIKLGWGTVQSAVQTALANAGQLGSNNVEQILDASAMALIDINLEAGKITTEEAVVELEKLGLGPEEARMKVQDFQDSIFALEGKVVYLDIVERHSQVGTGETPTTTTTTGDELTPKASGGSVYSGSSYLVGELGPEIFTPSQSGVITPNSALDLAPVVAAVVALGYKFDNFSRQLPKDVAAAVAVVV